MDEPPHHVAVSVTAPPPVPAPPAASALTRLLPVGTLVVTAAMVAVVFAVGSPMAANPMFLAFPVMMALSAVASLAHGTGRQAGADLNAARRRYLDYLGTLGGQLADSAAAQRAWLQQTHPEPGALWSLADTTRRWERDPRHHSFGRIRFGVGEVAAAACPVLPAQAEVDDVDPVTQTAMHRLGAAYAVLAAAPVTVDVRAVPLLRLTGDVAAQRGLARALLCQLATFHGPRHLTIAAVVAESQHAQWDWLKWLPHHVHPDLIDDIGQARLTFETVDAALAGITSAVAGGRHVVVVTDGVAVTADRFTGRTGVTGICIGRGGQETPGDEVRTLPAANAHPDTMSLVAATMCARRLAAHHGAADQAAHQEWLDLTGVAQPEALTGLWGTHDAVPRSVPLGVSDGSEPVYLDIKEAAFGGMGPHGLCLGATGSGKSELLRTLALGMIAVHSPEELNLILVDFKGGATFLGFERAHHVTAVITNLADEAYLVDRMQDALTGEIQRRQQLLRDAGNVASVAAYTRARRTRPSLPPLPALFVIVDEFSELLSRQPDFIDVFVAIGRLGRSLGIHLLLASQRLDEGRLRGLESHLSYRICLKTLSPNESRMAIGIPEAYHLPATPGAGYLKVGPDAPLRFQTAHVSGPAPDAALAPGAAMLSRPVVFTAVNQGRLRPATLTGAGTFVDRRLLDVVLDAVAGRGPTAHRVWLPPLADSPTVADLLPSVPAAGTLTVAIGVSDRALEQRVVPVMLELSGAAGNVAVVGAPQSGKSTTVCTLAAALSATHSPDQVQLYCLDFGGGALARLSGLPHVGVVAGRQQPELVHRTVAQVAAVVRHREVLFPRLGIDSMADYRVRGADSADPYGDVFLVIDGWATLRQDFDTLEPAITALATAGLSYGVHVVLAASRWADIRPGLKDQIGTRIELRLGDPVDSEIDRKRARLVPQNRPGHGLAADGYPMVVALPGSAPPAGAGTSAPNVRMLPDHLDYADLVRDRPASPSSALLGAGSESPSLTVDFTSHPFLVISGDTGCGKTTALRLLCHEIAGTGQADLYLMDPRRTLRADVDPERLAGYAMTAQQCGELATNVRGRLADASPAGPAVYLVIDDYDLISAATHGNPLTPVVELLPHARDIGLRVIIARRSAGSARAQYDPVLGVLRDCEAAGLQMSHSGDDGPLLGRSRPRPLPPGRGVLSTRAGETSVQVAWIPPR